MEDLARKLCEAVENEDSKEVENLLKYGANPNLVLPTGIAAIHLASGKESECALRCLTLILQNGGNPNVRSTDDLTPVHVAASWGCCKALIFLLRQGGDPSIEDQDGNTPLDLALFENNRRCVVALQEYKERLSGRYSDEVQGYNKNDSSILGDIPELSSITILLESTNENTQLSSTKISPLMSLPKVVNPGVDDAILSSQVEIPVFFPKDECRKENSYTSKYMAEKCDSETAKAKSEVPLKRILQSSPCDEFYSIYRESDITLDSSSISKKHNHEVSFKIHLDVVNTSLSNNYEMALKPSSSRCIHNNTNFEIFGKQGGLNVTSPDHVHIYNKEHHDENMEKTVCGNVSENEPLDEKETRSISSYTDCNTSLWESDDLKWGTGKIQSLFQNPNGIDDFDQSKDQATLLFDKDAYKHRNTHNSRTVYKNKEAMPAVENGGLREDCTHTAECTNQTVATDKTTISEYGNQGDLQKRLRNLLLSTKGCYRPESEAACPDTIIVESFKHHKEEKSDLQEDLKKTPLETKSFHSPSANNENNGDFFTPRSKSRLHSFRFRQNISSLFEDSVEMPKRGRRLRSPDGLITSPTPHIQPDDLLPKWSSFSGVMSDQMKTSDALNDAATNNSSNITLTNTISQGHTPDANLNFSNFLTDDLSSETEVKSSLSLKQTPRNNGRDDGIVEHAWLTEDGESEISGVAEQKNVQVCSSVERKPLPAALANESFFHSTLIEDVGENSSKAPRYSFSRLSCIPKDNSIVQLSSEAINDSGSEKVPLSPGGRPVTANQMVPVEYLYKDNEGHVFIEKHMPSINQSDSDTTENSDNTIIYNWRNYQVNTFNISKASSLQSPNCVAVELYRLSNDEIASRLRGLGESGHVTSQNRKMCILLLDKRLKEQTLNRPTGFTFEYSPELSLALNTFNIPDSSKDEAALSQEFDQPDKTRKWREGILKSSFNYLLLDPRVTRNLPSRFHEISQLDCFRTFVSAIFYVGKGKRSRPYCHLYEALSHYKGSCKQPCSKVQHIIEVWKSGQGVLSLHCFQNSIPVEAYTREACMVDAIGLKMLTNQKRGIFYGQAQNWTPIRRRLLGVHMLYKAMQIFLAEGERQLRPPDIRSGQ
ncbi:hypothetical protein GDO81_001021 [Engystomops pustulosus]|uniref:Ankyrin repeat and LEM domain-containing protein 1 n=2 Tax=Engystomops pustulosus TaxID=76066 RepID=A0AAV7D947_ENGPU|nr:hypothetical protein GDO81_001021 [Engystomops pustulosus]